MKKIEDLSIKIFADGAEKAVILEMYQKPYIQGFTTNPTLMRKAGISNYESFAREILSVITDLPISFEVFSDDFSEMKKQALHIASWGNNVYVKIPVTDTKGNPTYPIIEALSNSGVKLNITAITTLDQVQQVSSSLKNSIPSIISVFAGRIADTGVDPIPFMNSARNIISQYPNQELLWASPRELLNIFQADEIGCHIITVTNDILKKLTNVGKNLSEVSLDTVKMFYHDAIAAGFAINF